MALRIYVFDSFALQNVKEEELRKLKANVISPEMGEPAKGPTRVGQITAVRLLREVNGTGPDMRSQRYTWMITWDGIKQDSQHVFALLDAPEMMFREVRFRGFLTEETDSASV